MFYPSIQLTKNHINSINKVLITFLMIVVSLGLSKAGCEYKRSLQVDELQIGNMITWVTVSENNTDKFIIQKSKEGITFEILGEIICAGYSAKDKSYRFLDTSLGEEIAYYRLVQLDKDGTENYTPTVVINRNIKNNYVITGMSSTITDGLFSCSLRSNVSGIMILNLKNVEDNKVLESKEWPIQKGLNEVALDIMIQKNATYEIDFMMVGEKESIVVQKVDKDKVPNISYVVKK